MLREGIDHIPLNEAEVELYTVDVREDTYEEEAAFVAAKIRNLLDGKHMVRQEDELRPITADDIVILLRSPGSVGGEFRYALERIGIPCTMGNDVDLLQTPEVETLRAILQTIHNPLQDIPLLAVLASPVFGFSADELAAIRSADLKNSFYDAMGKCDNPKVTDFLALLTELRRSAAMESLSELFERIFNKTRLDSIYAAMDSGAARRTNLQTFYQLAVDFSALGCSDLDRFLEQLELMEERGLVSAEQSSGGCVRIMSIHKSKGLEFPVVYLCGLSRRFNQESSHAQVLCHKTMGLGLSCVDSKNRVRYPSLSKNALMKKMDADSLSEEMRVLYVAMTRARDRLIMTYASQFLQKDLADIALRSELSGQTLMTKYVSCPGDWVLYAAMKRIEAGELFHLAGRNGGASCVGTPWNIKVHDYIATEAENTVDVGEDVQPVEEIPVAQMYAMLPKSYSHMEATTMPSKQTATQLKGRTKDQEAAENTKEPPAVCRSWRQPSFRSTAKEGKTVGNATHAVLQYIRYAACTDETAVTQEISRLVTENYISKEQGELADAGRIARFFESSIGKKLQAGGHVLREFKFSILDDGEKYGPGLKGEQVLLQGVVDCALVEDDGMTILDFKTDRVTEETLEAAVERYRSQVETYGEAMERIYEMPVKRMYLYFFRLNRFVEL